MAHARLSASESKRWMNCPGSLRLSEGIPRRESPYAREGTRAHHLAAACLTNGRDADAYVGQTLTCEGEDGRLTDAFLVTEEMASAVQVFVEHVHAVREALLPAELHVERRFRLPYRDDMFGTGDAVVTQDFGVLHVSDYKHGAGVAVEAEDNSQLQYYGLGALEAFGWDFERVDVSIVQPRCSHPEGPVRRRSFTIAQMREFRDRLVEAAARTDDPDAPLAAGDWCQFCPARSACPELTRAAYEAAEVDFSAAGTPECVDVPSLLGDELSEKMRVLPAVKAWAKAVEEEAALRLLAGREVPGWKIVAGRGRRAWRDPEEARVALATLGLTEDQLLEPPAPRELRSPAKVEAAKGVKGDLKRAVKEAIRGLVSRTPGRPEVVPADDPREALDPAAAAQADFGEVADA